MEDKISKKKQSQNDFKKIAMKTLTEQLIQQQLAAGRSAGEILDSIMTDDLLLGLPDTGKKRLPKK